MAEEVITTFIADTSDYSAKFTDLENRLKTNEAAVASFGDTGQTAFKKTGAAADDLTDTLNNNVSKAFEDLGRKLIAAFAVERVLAFGNAAIQAFAAAELASNKLEFAVTKVLGGTNAQFQVLVKQSEALSNTSFFSPRQIQQAQSAQAAFGLTSDEISKLTPLILDLAAAQGVDLATATDTALRAITGQTRGLKTIGADFKATGSEIGNYNQLIENLGKISGAATQQLDTTSGALKNQEKEVEILEEKIGSRLASAWLSVKSATLEETKALYDLSTGKFLDKPIDDVEKFKTQFSNLNLDQINNQLKQLKGNVEDVYTVTGSDSGPTESPTAIVAAQVKALEELKKQREDEAKDPAYIQLTQTRNETIDNLNKEQLQNEINILDARKDRSTKDVQDEIARRQKAIDDIEAAEQKALDARIKAQQEASQKLAELRTSSEDKASTAQVETDPVKKLDAEYDAALQNAVRIYNATAKSTQDQENLKATLAAIEIEYENKISDETISIRQDTQKKIDELNKKNAEEDQKDNIANVESAGKVESNAIIKKYGDIGKLTQVQKDQLDIDLINNDINTQQTILDNVTLTADARRAVEKKLNDDLEKLSKDRVKQSSDEASETQKNIVTALQYAQKVGDQIFALSKVESNAKIQDLQDQQSAQDKVFSDEQKALDQSHTNKLISDRDYQTQSAAITQQQTDADTKAATQIAALKRQQAIADKEQAAFNVIIQTAAAIIGSQAKAPILGIPFIAFYAALGALELATVLAQPIPKFAKGTKRKEGSGMSLVGEEGPEVMFVPGDAKILPAHQTKQFGDAIDAMYDNRWDKFVFDKYVSPALMIQKAKHEAYEQENFAHNVANSFMLQNSGLNKYDLMDVFGKGLKINNVKQLAKAIASESRQTNNPYH